MGDRDERGRLLPGNSISGTANLKHGGEGAVARIRDGDKFIGLARKAELAVYDELSEGGRYCLLVRNAARFQAAADLFWGALMGAAEDGNLGQFHGYVKTWGWLNGAANRAWREVREEEAGQDGGLMIDAFDAAKEAHGD